MNKGSTEQQWFCTQNIIVNYILRYDKLKTPLILKQTVLDTILTVISERNIMIMSVNILLTLILLKISDVFSAPLLIQPYQPLPMQASQENLQQQLLDLQMAQVNPIPRFDLIQPHPLIILIPDQSLLIPKINENEFKVNNHKTKTKDKNEDPDSIVIDADPIPILEEQKAFLVIPDRRGIIGGFISAIPSLPLEINVPDSISWAYNGISSGISSIISIIGSRLPFQRPNQEPPANSNLKSMINELKIKNNEQQITNNVKPYVMMPLGVLNRPLSAFPLRMIQSQ